MIRKLLRLVAFPWILSATVYPPPSPFTTILREPKPQVVREFPSKEACELALADSWPEIGKAFPGRVIKLQCAPIYSR